MFSFVTSRVVTQSAVRFKHSSTQIKRLFKRHPAALRHRKVKELEPLPEPQFEAIGRPEILPNGWSAPLSGQRLDYPFSVSRTKNKPKDAIGFLPIYTKHRYVHNNHHIFAEESI